MLGGVVSTVGAFLGGHMSLRQALGANHAEEVAHLGPEDWAPLGPLADVPDGEPVRRTAGKVPVLVVRRGAQVTVLSDRCPHLSAPLSDGELTADTVVCPWHGNRVLDGVLQARVVTIPGVSAA